MISFWPDDVNYAHLMVCNEDGRKRTTPAGDGGINSSVQRIEISTGMVETTLHRMDRCDAIRTTQWCTVLARPARSAG